MIQAKFVVSQVTNYASSGPYAEITLEARYDSKIEEDRRFAKATPTGKLVMMVTNPEVLEQMKPNKVYYVNFVEAPEGTSPNHQ